MDEPTVVISARGEERVRSGHLWIYRADLADARAEGGDTVLVRGPRARVIGRALYSDRSQIALRLLSHGDAPAGLDLWRERLQTAVAFRASLGIDASAWRLVHGEGDLLPSLVVDRYGEYLVVQALSQGVDRLLPDLTALLVDLVRPAGILARHDARVRALEGLDRRVFTLHGEVPAVTAVQESGITYEVDLWKGQKTGLFLDQRENRNAAAGYASGRLLDCFSYNGGFALRLAAGCSHALALDISEEAVGRIARNAALNGITNVEARAANVFDELRHLERQGEQFDTIVLDPPAFAKNKAAVVAALAGYKEINLRALRLLRRGGFLITCSCSYHVDEATLGQVVFDAAMDAHVHLQVVEKRMQGRDHPILLGVPETYYLKCFVLRRLG
ncbi:MAG: class I SAM-dependent rRNA methyltransferase [Acidobacteria bacterium]|nr:class I SAM-dependent rRNA methyltransferase [Acidobacteriota bacterium]